MNSRSGGRVGAATSMWVNNAPYVGMIVLGAWGLYLAGGMGVWRWLGPMLYVGYGLGGTLWLVVFLCPHCAAHGSVLCPSGHGVVSGKLRGKRPGGEFARQFKRHIPVIVPMWFAPLVAGGVALAGEWSWGLAGVLAGFAAAGLVGVPMVSARHGCARCPQRGSCPWGKKKAQ